MGFTFFAVKTGFGMGSLCLLKWALLNPSKFINPKTLDKGTGDVCRKVRNVPHLCMSRSELAGKKLGFFCQDYLARGENHKESSRVTLSPRVNPAIVQFTNHSILRILFRNRKQVRTSSKMSFLCSQFASIKCFSVVPNQQPFSEGLSLCQKKILPFSFFSATLRPAITLPCHT